MAVGRKLLAKNTDPNYPPDAGEALAILAITFRGLQAVFALVHWFINTNSYIVSALLDVRMIGRMAHVRTYQLRSCN